MSARRVKLPVNGGNGLPAGPLIPFTDKLILPSTVVTQRLAFLGISGSGKTYGAGVLVEGLHELRLQVVIVDIVGNWYGLRLGADGKSKGLSIPILGGDRGDVPLEPDHGKLAAEVVTESRASMILDISDFTPGEIARFVRDFAATMLRLKKRSPSPVMIVWEECHEIVPQRLTADVAGMFGAVERLVKRGRNYGVGTMLISQRPAAVNKDVLYQIETMFAFRTGGPGDRDAIADWMKAKSLAVDLDELPELETGTCICWSPKWLGVAVKSKVRRKRTFDATKTPEHGDVAAGELAPVDLERFKVRMADAIAKAEADDPALLRRKVADLEAQLKRASAAPEAAPAAPPGPDPHQVAVRAYDAGFEHGWLACGRVTRSRLVSAFDQPIQAIKANAEQAALWPPPAPGKQEGGRSIPIDVFGPEAVPPSKRDVIRQVPAGAALAPGERVVNGHARHRAAVQSQPDGHGFDMKVYDSVRTAPTVAMSKGAAAVLEVLIQHGVWLDRSQLTVLTGYKKSSRDTYIGQLAQLGLASTLAGQVMVTPVGRDALPSARPLPTGEQLRTWWMARLGAGERRVLEVLVRAHPEALNRDQVSDRTHYKKSSRDTYIGKLVARRLVETGVGPGHGLVRASDALFNGG